MTRAEPSGKLGPFEVSGDSLHLGTVTSLLGNRTSWLISSPELLMLFLGHICLGVKSPRKNLRGGKYFQAVVILIFGKGSESINYQRAPGFRMAPEESILGTQTA